MRSLEDAKTENANLQVTPTNLAVNALHAIVNDIKTPSLTELQMLFGFGGIF